MARGCGRRKDVLDWWQAVLDETKKLVDDTIDRVRDDDDDDDRELEDEIKDLKKVIAALNAKIDAMTPPAPELELPGPGGKAARR